METNVINWEKLLLEAFNSTPFGCLATHGDEGVWASPVFFSWDEACNLYFISEFGTRHMDNILQNQQVSYAIYPTNQADDVLGLQIVGNAKVLKEQNDIHSAFSYYFGRIYPGQHPKFGDKIDSPYAYNPDWNFVKITPSEIFMFDTRYFGEKRVLVPEGTKVPIL